MVSHGRRGLPPQAIPASGPVAGLKILSDERLVVTGSFDGGVRIWDLRKLVSSGRGGSALVGLLPGHGDRVTRVDATPDAIYSASFDTSVRVWNFAGAE